VLSTVLFDGRRNKRWKRVNRVAQAVSLGKRSARAQSAKKDIDLLFGGTALIMVALAARRDAAAVA
jgi:accessory colonization factor AcfC